MCPTKALLSRSLAHLRRAPQGSACLPGPGVFRKPKPAGDCRRLHESHVRVRRMASFMPRAKARLFGTCPGRAYTLVLQDVITEEDIQAWVSAGVRLRL